MLAGLLTPLVAAGPAAATVPVPSAPSCTSTVVPGIPLATESSWVQPFAVLSATDNHGLWAGIRYDGEQTIQVIAWRAGVTRVLDSFTYNNEPYDPYRSVQVIGITSARAVIVNAEGLSGAKNGGDVRPYRYQDGHRYSFGHNASWTSWTASGVTAAGQVAGTAATPKGGLVVSWNQVGTAKVIANGEQAMVDKYGDLIWQDGSSRIHYRTPSGRLGALQTNRSSSPILRVNAGRWVWAEAGQSPPGFAVITWDMAAAARTSNIQATSRAQQHTYLQAGSQTGAYVAASESKVNSAFAYYDAWNDRRPLNSFGEAGNGPAPFFGFGADGTLSYAGADGRPVFTHCPLNYAAHNPRGLIYRGAVSAGKTVITGGAFDSDALASHVSVDIYDETTSVRRRLTRVVADQADPSFSSAYGISGNHRYRYSFPSAHGKHVYCAYGMNIGYGNTNTKLGCTTVTS